MLGIHGSAGRAVVATLSVGALLACGGGGEGDPVTPPPPPPPVQATTLVVAGGNDQQATAGLAVTTAPGVRAVSATNTGVAGVVVTFTIESGGGSLQFSQATTGQDGVASAGQWTLGAVPGENTIRASANGLAPVTIRAIGMAAPLVGADTTIAVGGGSVEINQPGKPGDGMRVTIPSSAFAASVHVTIDVDTGRTLTLPAGVSIAGPVYRISGFPEHAADGFLTIRLPVTKPFSTVVAAFLRDPTTGRLELLPAQSRTATEYTVVARHLSPAMLLRPSGTAFRRVGAPALSLAGQTLELLTLEAIEARIASGAESGFRPGVDDWEFENRGSYISQGGHCAGQSLSAIWYYLRRKSIDGPLHGRLSTIPGFDPDNRDGYRFASVVQESLDWNAMERAFLVVTGTGFATSVPRDKLHFTASVLSMIVTGEPQLITLQNQTGGHAVVAFRADANHLYIADPNYPGQTRVIDFDGTTYTPFPAETVRGAQTSLYDIIRGVGITTLVPLGTVDALWPQVMSSTIGDQAFPALRYEYYDLLNDAWANLPGSLVTRQDQLRVRSICGACTQGMPVAPGTTPPDWVEWLSAHDAGGNVVGDSWQPAGQTTDGTTFPLASGAQKIGLFTQADSEDAIWVFLDWTWLDVTSVPFTIEPADAKVAPGIPAPFVARPYGVRPAVARYVWDFSDGTAPVTVLDDSTVQHSFAASGLRTVSVELWDHAAAKRLARAVTSVEVGDSITTWIFDELKGTVPPWSPVDVSTANDWTKQGLFFAAIQTAPATGRLDYNEPPGHPERGRIRLVVSPSPTTFSSLLMATRDTVCSHIGVLNFTGTTTNGSLIGRGRINSCLIGPTPGTPVLASRFEIEGTAVGRHLTGTIRAVYQDFSKAGSKHIPTASMTVTYTFKAHRP